MIMGNVSERRKQPPQVGVSVVILALGPASHGTQEHARTSAGSTLWIPLVRRVRQPFLGQWALPGGGLRADHSLEQSAYVALESTTSLHPRYLEQLYTFGDPARSHGGLPMVSIVYWALVDDLNGQLGQSIDDNVKWFPVDDLPELAFDHGDIVDYALSRLRGKIEYPQIVTRLVGERFTLSQLHDVYEAVAGQSIAVRCSHPGSWRTPVTNCVSDAIVRQRCIATPWMCSDSRHGAMLGIAMISMCGKRRMMCFPR